MELVVKRFEELNLKELYDIYKLRVDVFVVEQNCPYHEVDDNDLCSIHVFLKDEDNSIAAYCRVIPAGKMFENVAIGRVIAAKRRQGYGTKIVKAGLDVARGYFNAESVEIEAQVYARELYEKVGFEVISDEFVEDGIPHVKMIFRF